MHRSTQPCVGGLEGAAFVGQDGTGGTALRSGDRCIRRVHEWSSGRVSKDARHADAGQADSQTNGAW